MSLLKQVNNTKNPKTSFKRTEIPIALIPKSPILS